ncbi:MAG: QueT transporter family protein [Erysipelotrichaceae bacterium]
MKNRNLVRRIAFGAMIGALYAAVSIALAPLSFGNVQIRIAEALTLLAIFFPEAIMGLTLGCFLTNLVGNFMGVNIAGPIDIFVGTFATFLAAVLSYRLRHIRYKNIPWAAAIPPILINAIFIGLELAIVIGNGMDWTLFGIFALEVGLGQLVAVCVLGIPLVMQLEKTAFMNRYITK